MDAASCVVVLLQHRGILISYPFFFGRICCYQAWASLPWCKGFTCKCWCVLMVLLGAIINLYHVWILNSLIWCRLYPFFCTDWAPAMENNLSACKVFHTFTLPIHTLVCTVLWNISLLCSFGFLHVQCALTLFCKVGSVLQPMVKMILFLLL